MKESKQKPFSFLESTKSSTIDSNKCQANRVILTPPPHRPPPTAHPPPHPRGHALLGTNKQKQNNRNRSRYSLCDRLLRPYHWGFASDLLPEPIAMRTSLVRFFLTILANTFLHSPYQHSSPPESSQCSTPLGSESGGKRRRGRRGKQKGLGEVVSVHEKKEAKTSPFPLLLLCRATRRRITEVYDEMYQIVRAKRNDTGKVSNIFLYLWYS